MYPRGTNHLLFQRGFAACHASLEWERFCTGVLQCSWKCKVSDRNCASVCGTVLKHSLAPLLLPRHRLQLAQGIYQTSFATDRLLTIRQPDAPRSRLYVLSWRSSAVWLGPCGIHVSKCRMRCSQLVRLTFSTALALQTRPRLQCRQGQPREVPRQPPMALCLLAARHHRPRPRPHRTLIPGMLRSRNFCTPAATDKISTA